MSALLVFAVVVGTSLAFSSATLACECTRKSTDHKYEGGDKNPLTWYSRQRLEHPGDRPVHCYEREVRNHISGEVRDVYWPVAGYRRDALPSPPVDCCCQAASIPGSLKQPDPTGLLYHGPGSSSSYPTTSYAPQDGWPAFYGKLNRLNQPSAPTLTSVIELAVLDPQGKRSVSTIQLVSSVSSDGGVNTYQYNFTNRGEEPLFLFWDIPKTEEFQGQFPITLAEPLGLPPNKSVSRVVRSKEEAGWAYTTVIVLDGDKKTVAAGMASVYGFARGRLSKDTLQYWKTPERK